MTATPFPRPLPSLAAAAGLALLLTGCGGSTPIRYHALAPQPGEAPVAGSARVLVEVLPVTVPERLNRTQLVLTDAGGRLDVRDDDRWAAPVADEMRLALANALWQRLRAIDVYQAPVAPAPNGPPQYRLALRVERFDATPGGTAVVDGSWTMRRLPQGPASTCRGGFSLPVAAGTPDAAAAALSNGAAQLAAAVADSLGRLDQVAPGATPSPCASGGS
ncbi:PqiC family protein [Nitrospirillum sp. BR 11163]|uniref:PqiC family protein n=1 Tax=Nitrospirillum sp. BR 11163 TaxID=3104323 RepID=UPI002AFF3FC5|nr:PqiC family protein [Nitrospirillum sp. BR 11163]MEA1674992.1 PqiC family protein [Nitrospirillum sp. BR 11163]